MKRNSNGDTETGRHGETAPIHPAAGSPGRIFFEKITIIGVGLIGASFALGVKHYGLCRTVVGHGRKEENLRQAKEKNIIDAYELDPAKACDGADLVVFAAPVGIFIDIAKKIRGSLKKGAVVTDVGSVKGRLVRDLETLIPDGVFFVGGHPIAGGDRSGIDTASAEIFHNAQCILTPTKHTDGHALEKVTGMWETLGSVVKIIGPDEHDRIYAAMSHLPHLIAYELVNTVADIDRAYFTFSGQGFKDTTRIASSHHELWRDICLLNKDNLLEYVEIFKSNLDRVSQYLRAHDAESLERDFEKARTLREALGQN
jgi:prephenate dehydrogenase